MNAQLWSAAVVGGAALAAASLELWRARRAHRLSAGATGVAADEPYILYFTGESCTVCQTHQEPALARLGPVRVDRVDAVADRDLADRFHIYTLPTTVVISAEGKVLNINYGYAPATKLQRQLTEARGLGMGAPATA